MQGLKCGHQPQLVFRAGPGKDIHFANEIAKLVIIQLVQFRTGQHPLCIFQAQLAGNSACRYPMITGNHLDPDSGIVALRNRPNGLLPGRIQKPDQAEQLGTLLKILNGQFTNAPLCRFSGQGQHSEAIRCHFCDDLLPEIPAQLIGFPGFGNLAGAHIQDPLRRTFQVDQAMSVVVMVQRGHEAILGIERYFIFPWPVGGTAVDIKTGFAGEHRKRGLHGIACDPDCAGIMVDMGVVTKGRCSGKFLQQYGVRRMPLFDIHRTIKFVAFAGHLQPDTRQYRPGYHHFVTGEGAGFIRTDYRHRAQGFDNRHSTNHGLTTGHLAHTNGQGNGENRRQPLGDSRNNQAHHGHEQLPKWQATEYRPAAQNRDTGNQNNDGENSGEPVHLFQQGSLQCCGLGKQAGNTANLGTGACADNHASTSAGGDHSAGEGHTGLVAQGSVCSYRLCRFFNRLGLTRENGLIDFQVVGFLQTKIGGHPVPWLQQHRITRNQVRSVYLMLAIGPRHPGFGGKHVTNGRQGLLGLALLDKTHQGLDNHDGKNNAGIHPVAQAGRNNCGRCQHVNQKIFELSAQPRPRPPGTSLRQRIGAVTGKPLVNLIG